MKKTISLSLTTFGVEAFASKGTGCIKLTFNTPKNDTEFFIGYDEYSEFIDFLITAREYCLHNREEINRGQDDNPSSGHPF